ncbi:MAG: S41 family peptidase [Bacteroidales bacterium]
MAYQNSKKDIVYPIVLAAVLVVGIFIGIRFGNRTEKPNLLVYPKSDKLTSVINYIQEEYVDTVSMNTIVENTIPSLLKNLDPHSVYIPASEFESVNEPLEGGFDGIGVQFNMSNDTAVVINTIPGGPSERLGILAGDRIITVNGKNIAGIKFPFDSIPKLLKGPTGTHVNVGIKRSEVKELIDFEIIRDKIPINSVDVSYMVFSDVGYIKITTFAKTTYVEFLNAVDKLRDLGMKKLILDLRSNSGGYMDAATNIANEFLSKDKLIVYTQGKNRARQDIYSNGRGECQDLSLEILIDEFSASASEILAGAIQDNDRGKIIGRRSFGKGLVQEQIFFSDGSALRLTIARYYTPSGRSIQKPYKPGDDDYFNDISNRYIHGEFQEADSIQFADSLKYFTVGGRVVYGGGGIMPDVFVPLDTAGITPYLQQVSRRNLIYRYAFAFTDKHRKETRSLKDFNAVNGFLNGFNLVNDFVQYAEQNGIKPNSKEIQESRLIIETQLKATIARNIIDSDGFYPYIKNIDETLLKAIDLIEKSVSQPTAEVVSLSGVDPSILIQSQLKTWVRNDFIAATV